MKTFITKTFPYAYNGKGGNQATAQAQAWIVAEVAKYRKAYADEGANICDEAQGVGFRTTGNDFVEAAWCWDNDDEQSPITATVRGS